MRVLYLSLLLLFPTLLAAQTTMPPTWIPKINGTVRTKWEWQHQSKEHRFEMRNARLSFMGEAMRGVNYKAEVDLSDEGQYRTLDVFGEIAPFVAMEQESKGLFTLRMGQFRVPFSIDPHRSPHVRFFANRSFLSKQLGNVRDVGLQLAYARNWGDHPLARWELRAGVFNGSGITRQKHYWTRSFNYSARLQASVPIGLTATVSTMKVRPECGDVYLYDGCLTFERGPLTLEAEYLGKYYAKEAFARVDGINLMALYDIDLAGPNSQHRFLFDQLSLRLRYDYMSAHSDGSLDATTGKARLTDVERARFTRGINLRFARRHTGKTDAQLRLNHEQYFYPDKHDPRIKASDRNKFVAELVLRF